MSVPPNFNVVGCDSELAAEIDTDFSHFFPSTSRGNSTDEVHVSSQVSGDHQFQEDECDFDIGSDEEDSEQYYGKSVTHSPILNTRMRIFVRNGSERDIESDQETCVSGDDNFEDDTEQECDTTRMCSKGCQAKFRNSDIVENRLNIQGMDRDVRDMFYNGQLQACGTTRSMDGVSRPNVKRHRFDYQFQNTNICKSCFLYINNINGHYLKNIRTHFIKHGAVPRIHGNTGKKPKNAVTYDHVQQVVQFISRYADEIGLPQPAAPRGRDSFPPIYLPGSDTYISVHKKYTQVCLETGNRCLSETTFRRIWHQCLPHIQFMSCKTDVCHKCESFRNRIQKATTETDKMEATTDFANHISSAQMERDYYRERCQAAIAGLRDHPKSNVAIPPASLDLDDVHYTFDFAQSVLLPTHCRQEGALYFIRLDWLRALLTVDKRKTSAAIRLRTSARDDRISVVAIGGFGLGILSALTIGIVLPDIIDLLSFFYKSFRTCDFTPRCASPSRTQQPVNNCPQIFMKYRTSIISFQ
ncbi:uncharacterized protein [Argopecten irradians]|uniref:uncharacterized protein n=1 Tax=Argopecten irradians TaxID=31199 RepID=UPI00370FECBE